jgi:hypothetical protein
LGAQAQLAISSNFGSDVLQSPGPLTGKLIEMFTGLRAFITDLKGAGGWKLNLGEFKGGAFAATSGKSSHEPQRIITFSQSHLEKHHSIDVASTLIHEGTHAIFDTVDYFYLDSSRLSNTPSVWELTGYIAKLSTSAQAMVSSGPDEKVMKTHLVAGYQQRMAPYISASAGPEERRKVYIQNPKARAWVGYWNADTPAAVVLIANSPLVKFIASRSGTSRAVSGR